MRWLVLLSRLVGFVKEVPCADALYGWAKRFFDDHRFMLQVSRRAMHSWFRRVRDSFVCLDAYANHRTTTTELSDLCVHFRSAAHRVGLCLNIRGSRASLSSSLQRLQQNIYPSNLMTNASAVRYPNLGIVFDSLT